jgi:small subunit ribosomal protein S17
MEAKRNARKEIVGRVASAKMDKTISVSVVRSIKHPKYGKYFKKTKTFYAHDDKNECNQNDIVRIMETRPLSRLKRWRLVEIVERAK